MKRCLFPTFRRGDGDGDGDGERWMDGLRKERKQYTDGQKEKDVYY